MITIERILVNTKEKFDEFLKDINDIFAFDTETTSLNIQELNLVGISFHCGTDKSWYIPFGHTQGLQLDMREEVMSQLKDLFCKAKLVIGHNLVFDMQVLRRYNLYPEYTPWFDTMIAYHLIDENDRKGLKYLSKKFLNYTMKTFEETTKGQNISYADMETTKDYACDDAIQTWKLFKLFKKDLLDKDLKSLMKDIEMPFLRCIIEMEHNGILIDREKVKELTLEVKDKLVEVEENIANALPSKFKQKTLGGTYKPSINLGSSKDLVKLLYGELGLEIKYKTDKGVPAVGTPILKKYENKHPIIPLLIKYKMYQKLQTSFLRSLPKHICDDGRVHCRFNDTGARTGRLSSSDPNLQQLPKNKEIKIRSCFIASPGTKFIVLDYSQEELRFTAFLAQDKVITKAFNEGLDLHLLTANKVFNLGLSDVELEKGTEEFKVAKGKYGDERDKAKGVTFGLLFGMTEYNLSDRLQISLEEAKQIMKDYFNAMPSVKTAIDKAHESIKNNGFVRNYYGRYRHFTVNDKGVYPGVAYRQSFNFKIQGSCADLLRVSMINVYKFLKENNDEGKLIFTVHDEMCIEVPEDKVDFYLNGVKKVMENCLIINPPLIAEGSAGSDYAEAK